MTTTTTTTTMLTAFLLAISAALRLLAKAVDDFHGYNDGTGFCGRDDIGDNGDDDEDLASMSPEVESRCPVCLSGPRALVVTPDSCDHVFCLSCLRRWSRESRTCPMCRRSFSKIYRHVTREGRCRVLARAALGTVGVVVLVLGAAALLVTCLEGGVGDAEWAVRASIVLP